MTTQETIDAEVAASLREAVGKVNHFAHVAHYRGLFVQLTTVAEPGRVISDVCVMRPILPPTTKTESA